VRLLDGCRVLIVGSTEGKSVLVGIGEGALVAEPVLVVGALGAEPVLVVGEVVTT